MFHEIFKIILLVGVVMPIKKTLFIIQVVVVTVEMEVGDLLQV